MTAYPLKLIFILPDLEISGGVSLPLAHARYAAKAGLEVAVAVTSGLGPGASAQLGDGVTAMPLADVATREFDVAIASWWRDVLLLPRLTARRRIHYVQGPEDRFYESDDGPSTSVRDLYRIPLSGVAVSYWLEGYLRATFARNVQAVVQPGIEKATFSPTGPAFASRAPGRLRVLVEGPLGVPFKNVVEALRLSRSIADETWLLTSTDVGAIAGVDRVFSRLRPPEAAAVYRSCDVLLKLSVVEGFGLPPLEMFHCGGTCIVFASTGPTDFAEHESNALVAPLGDFGVAGRMLAGLRRNRQLLERLKAGALETSAGWPNEAEAAAHFVDAVEGLVRGAPRDDASLLRQLDEIDRHDTPQRRKLLGRVLHNRRTRSLKYSIEVARRGPGLDGSVASDAAPV